MDKFIRKLPENPSFKQDGMDGYCSPLLNKDLGLVMEDCYKGHERYTINSKTTHIYYVLEGEGTFSVQGNVFDVKKDNLIEIPPNHEFVFAGKMKLLLVNTPDFNPEDVVETKLNDLY